MRKYILLITIFIIFIFPSFLFAQESSSSATNEIKPEVLEKVKDRLENTENTKEQLNQKSWYSKFGIVTQVNPSSIIIKTNNEESPVEIRVSPETELSYYQNGLGTQILTYEELQKDWFAIAMGNEITNNKNLVAARISFSQNLDDPIQKQTLVGKVSEIDDTSLTISNDDENSKTTLSIPQKYKLYIKNTPEPDFEDITIEDKIIVIAKKSTNQDNETKKEIIAMYIIPGNNSPL